MPTPIRSQECAVLKHSTRKEELKSLGGGEWNLKQ